MIFENHVHTMNENDDCWVKADWLPDDLQDKRVQFELTAPDKKISATGVFRVRQSPTGELHIEIVVTTSPSYWQRTDDIFTLRQIHAEKIKRHPDQSIAEFQLFG